MKNMTRSGWVSVAVLTAIALPLAWATPRATPALAVAGWALLASATLTAIRRERRARRG